MAFQDHSNQDIVAELAGMMLNGAIMRWARYVVVSTPTGSEQDTGFDFPARSLILPYPIVSVITAEATGGTPTLDVGLLSSESGGDANGFLAAVDVSSTGLIKGTLASGGQTLGALLRVDESGAGVLVPEPHVIATAVSLTFTAGSNDWAEFRGRIYVPYIEIDDTDR